MTSEAPWLGSAKGAVISPCGKYRYALWRRFGEYAGSLWPVFVMLNPSTADASEDDPTIRRVCAFASSWGYAQVLVVNLFAYRATNPRELARATDAHGPDNDDWIARAASGSDLVVCAWGKHGGDRAHAVREALVRVSGDVAYLKLNGDGSPAHPLYLSATLRPKKWPYIEEREQQ
jgi:hypothetical protein